MLPSANPKFFSFSIPKTTTAKALAIELAKRTRFLRDNVIAEELKEENVGGTQTLEGFYKAFKDHLIASLTLQDFSDLFAQTITYGLFAARSRATNGFNRKLAYDYIPHTIGILRDVFRFISSADLPQSMEWIIDDIAEVLATSDVKKIMENFYKEGRGHDPIIHFYETFLAEYDPKERAKRGVYYTPEPVVSYIVRSIHKLLKEKFGKEDGFATQSVTVLDPASGTLTFPVEAIRQSVTEFKDKYGEGGVSGLIKTHILKNFYAFELMMASYAIGHLKVGFILDEFGYKLSGNERFNLFLTNTLDFTKEDPSKFPGVFEQAIAKESLEALKVKEDIPIMVVMGNPPYSVSSTNIVKEGTEFYNLYESYKEVVRKKERNIQPLSDDYIKFIAFAHWKVKQAGQGIVGMITNNSYLDGLIHRDLRRKLLEDFSEIYILNLHGSTKRQEKTPEGEKDENVFDIQQGVSIILLIKNDNLKKSVKYADVWGLREEKYSYLEKNNVSDTRWRSIKPQPPHNFFTIKDFEGIELYDQFVPLDKIFRQLNAGVATGKDDLLVSFNKDDLVRKLSIAEKTLFDISMQSYKIPQVLGDRLFEELKGLEIENSIVPYNYRPFDVRYVVYNKRILQRARDVIMGSFLKPNLGLVSLKGIRKQGLGYFFVTDKVTDRHILDTSADTAYVFPLYIYNSSEQQGLLEEIHKSNNLQWGNLGWLETLQSFTSSLSGNFIQPTEAIFYYVYAILYSNIYREKYQEFLKIDFPRIPFAKDYHLFQALAQRGEQLVNLHLLKDEELQRPIAKFQGGGDNQVEKREYEKFLERLHINDSQYFNGVKSEVWNYYIGGYQVLDKWLKDRVGKALSAEDVRHYCKIATAISRTIDIQKEIDRVYPKVENDLR
ncbi:MAG: hypothetical protein UX25_C0042G0009 [Candidatus Woesebacteria bacterium GW2011_GWC2_45_9]|uniref:site-specific DNA-methyltransferase (adenine-specific) n=1 Tax=Candidatus Woesebacteria bacterium GW2011_GWC2_45_9 TaxID=1618589 RepID=A0A0G1N779_9BACT|nr:MAG: hypothetical protein UX25_C0042G0009 [Candidatus Woesebacteria bacterium GW2011_GWC2_45_9]